MTKVSLIMPVRNEENSVQETLESVFAQTRRPDEIVIGDGCSTDRTLELIRSFENRGIPVEIVRDEKIYIGAGRNVAIQKAKHDIIAATDFGIVLDVHWLEEITGPFQDGPGIDLVVGRAVPRVKNEFENCVASVLHTSNSRDLNRIPAEEIQRLIAKNPPLPGGNSVAFRKVIWRKAGGYPDWLRTSEDKLFARKVLSLGGRTALRLNAVAYYDPRSNFRSVFRQFYCYGKGNAQSRQISKGFRRLFIKTVLGVFLFFAGFVHFPIWYLLGLCVVIHIYRAGFRPYRLVNDKLPGMKGFVWIPLILLVHHGAAIAGHLGGCFQWFLNGRYRSRHYEYMRAR